MRIRVEHLKKVDFPIISDWLEPNLFPIFHSPVDDSQLERLLTKYDGERPTELGWKAVRTDNEEMVGLIHVVFDWKNEMAHIQQIIVGEPEMRRQGIETAMMEAMLEVCFRDHKLHRVQLFVDEDNETAIGFYRKLGFAADGLMREAKKVGDSFRNWYCMSVLVNEWSGSGTNG